MFTLTALSLCLPPLVVFLLLYYKNKVTVQYKRQWTQLVGYLTTRNKLQGYLTPAYDCFWKNARGRKIQDPYTFVPHHRPLTASPHQYNPPDSSWKRGPCSLGAFSVSPLPAEDESHLSFSSKLCPCIFYSVFMGRENQDFSRKVFLEYSIYINRP